MRGVGGKKRETGDILSFCFCRRRHDEDKLGKIFLDVSSGTFFFESQASYLLPDPRLPGLI